MDYYARFRCGIFISNDARKRPDNTTKAAREKKQTSEGVLNLIRQDKEEKKGKTKKKKTAGIT